MDDKAKIEKVFREIERSKNDPPLPPEAEAHLQEIQLMILEKLMSRDGDTVH